MLKQWHKVVFSLFSFATIIFLFFSGFLARVDYVLYDTFMWLTKRDAPEQIVIVNIDDKSLGSLGRWPWSRETHAEMLDILTNAGVKTVGFDILFSDKEQNNPKGDQLFAEAIARNGKVVLAISPQSDYNGQGIGELLPLPMFAKHASALAHVDFELDNDGRSRSVYLAGGLGNAHWPAFGLALGGTLANLTAATIKNEGNDISGNAAGWLRKKRYLIPFVGPPNSFQSFSYIDILNHQINPKQLKDKIILIGVTASGLGDVIATPSSTEHKLMSGVELNANVLAGLLDNIEIKVLPTWLYLLVTLVIFSTFYWFLNFSPRKQAPAILISSLILGFFFSTFLFVKLYIWYAPVFLLLGLSMVYIFWDWFVLESTTRTIKDLRHQIFYHSRYDDVTALPNRTRLQEFIQLAIEDKIPQCGLLVVNLGRFKILNDRLGYKSGDTALNMAAARIRKAVGNDNKIARLSGGDFAVFMENIDSEQGISHCGAMILQALQLTFILENKEFYLKPRIGISTYPRDGNNADTLFNNALTAMHQAKRDKRRGLYFFSSSLKDDLFEQLDLEQDIHGALDNQQFELHYQPQVDADNAQIIGFEALLRWHHPDRGLIPPGDFIPLAEYTGDIVKIGYWVMETACLQGKAWIKEGLTTIRMAVNLSSVQFAQDDIVENIADIITKTGFPASQLELELTESMLIDDIEAATKTLGRLKELGVQLSVDDFGTGYSSLNYLRRFPMDRIKIDKSFVDDLGKESGNSEITTAIIDMAHRLDMEVIAEGVETSSQKDFLRSQHCEELQGFYFSRPVPAEEINDILAGSKKNQINLLAPNISLPKHS